MNPLASQGDFDIANITATSQGNVGVSDTVQVRTQVPFTVNWFDDLESGWGAWTNEVIRPSSPSTNWEIGDPAGWGPGTGYYNSTNCAGTNVAENYYPSADITFVTPYVELGASPQIFNFYTWYQMDTYGDDGGFVEISANGGPWSQITPKSAYPYTGGYTGGYYVDSFSGISSGWEFYEFNLSAWSGQVVQTRFHFAASDGWGWQDGWYVDDIYMGAPPPYRCELTPDLQNGFGSLGTDVDYTLTVANTGLNNDTYNLSATGNAWATTFLDMGMNPITAISVPAGGSADFIVRVTVNPLASQGDFDIANIITTSQNSTADDTATVTTMYLIVPTNVAVFRDADPWGSSAVQDILATNGIPYDIYNSGDIGMVSLVPYDKVIIPSDQPQGFYNTVEANL